VPPLTHVTRPRGADPAAAWQLAEEHVASLQQRLLRAHASTQAVIGDWLSRADRVIGAAELQTSAPVVRRLLRRWIDEGLVRAAVPHALGEPSATHPPLNDEQFAAAQAIIATQAFTPFLLH